MSPLSNTVERESAVLVEQGSAVMVEQGSKSWWAKVMESVLETEMVQTRNKPCQA